MVRITALYPNAAGSHFNPAYYRDRHEPFATRLLSPLGLTAIRSTIGIAAVDGSPPPFWAISEMVFASRAHFDDAMGACGDALFADIPNYTSVSPVLQFSLLDGDDTDLGSLKDE